MTKQKLETAFDYVPEFRVIVRLIRLPKYSDYLTDNGVKIGDEFYVDNVDFSEPTIVNLKDGCRYGVGVACLEFVEYRDCSNRKRTFKTVEYRNCENGMVLAVK